MYGRASGKMPCWQHRGQWLESHLFVTLPMREETQSDGEKTVDTPPAPHTPRPIGLAAAPVERVVAPSAPGARDGRMAGGWAAPHAVGHGPGCAADGPAVSWGPDLVPAPGALLGTPGDVLAG